MPPILISCNLVVIAAAPCERGYRTAMRQHAAAPSRENRMLTHGGSVAAAYFGLAVFGYRIMYDEAKTKPIKRGAI